MNHETNCEGMSVAEMRDADLGTSNPPSPRLRRTGIEFGEESRAAFDDVKDQAKQAVIRDKYFALVKQLRGAAKVEIPDANLKKAVDTMEAGK